jgi:hypothetical protein
MQKTHYKQQRMQSSNRNKPTTRAKIKKTQSTSRYGIARSEHHPFTSLGKNKQPKQP